MTANDGKSVVDIESWLNTHVLYDILNYMWKLISQS